jgi:hypothetical protein
MVKYKDWGWDLRLIFNANIQSYGMGKSFKAGIKSKIWG